MSLKSKKKVVYDDSDRCGKCDIFVRNEQNGVCCDYCHEWYHLKCSSLTKSEFSVIKSALWMCKKCYSNTFPFTNMIETAFYNQIPLINPKIKGIKFHKFDSCCSVCTKKVHNHQSSYPCNMCKSLIHKKCTSHNNSDWMCANCATNLPFNDTDAFDLLPYITFNSNYDCACKHKNQVSSQDNLVQEYTDILKSVPNFFSENGDLDEDTTTQPIDFKFYDIHDFHKRKANLTLNENNNLSILHTNIQSLNCNFDKLEILINSLDYHFDILALTETWNGLNRKNFSPGVLNDYQNYYGTNGTTLKSGCGFYISEKLNYIPRKDLQIQFHSEEEEFQTSWIEIIIPNKSNIIVGTSYRHPTSKNAKFLEYLEQTMLKIKKSSAKVVLCGDFNINLLNFQKNEATRKFLSVLHENLFLPHIVQPTRFVNKQKPSLIDNIFTNFIIDTPISGNLISKISDHLPNFLIIRNISNKTPPNQNEVYRDFSRFNLDNFKEDLSHRLLTKFPEISNDTNMLYNAFHNAFLSVIDIHAPFKSKNRKQRKKANKPWITSGILKSTIKSTKLT